jgi:hypothetical protein
LRHAAKGPPFHSGPLATYRNGPVSFNVRPQNNSRANSGADQCNTNSHQARNNIAQMANEIWAALIGVAGAIGGVWYGAKLSRQAARDLLAQQAKAEFASAFTDTLLKLSGPIQEDRMGRAFHILQEDYPRHFAAYIKLRTILPQQEQEAIDEAWKNYARDDKNDPLEEREFYRFKHVLGPESDEHQYMLAAKHINALLTKTAA